MVTPASVMVTAIGSASSQYTAAPKIIPSAIPK